MKENNMEELEKEELKFKDQKEDEDDKEESNEKDEKEEEDLKDKISNYFTVKSKKSGLTLALEGISSIGFLLEIGSTVFEKIKNLILWKSKPSTMLVFVSLGIGYLVLTFLPIRFFIILGIVNKFKKGYTYYNRIYNNNGEIARIEILRFLENDQFDLCEEWPKIKNLEKKLNSHLQTTLNIFIPNDGLTFYQHPIELVEKIGRIKKALVLPDNEENEEIKRTNKKLYFKTKNIVEKLLDYVMNNIPSDFYLIRYSEQIISKNYL